MVILGGRVFLMSEVPLYGCAFRAVFRVQGAGYQRKGFLIQPFVGCDGSGSRVHALELSIQVFVECLECGVSSAVSPAAAG